MTRRSSTLSTAASGRSNTTSGVANKGRTSGAVLILTGQATPAAHARVVQITHQRAGAFAVQQIVLSAVLRSHVRAVEECAEERRTLRRMGKRQAMPSRT